eukprot:TRINITY_DN45035_c0_g1_i1.p1 TRINITY_DN45035_c0_g1~~TRINITY_DN45035_c0_g1_i1.p1  ORF type:complete len:445 (+),score=41.11 TRINITY_DN45035_c0_g1_i1:122-1456(+)
MSSAACTSLMGESTSPNFTRSSCTKASRLPSVPGPQASRLAREGVRGGGTINTANRQLLNSIIGDLELHASVDSPASSDTNEKTRRRISTPRSKGVALRAAAASPTNRDSDGPIEIRTSIEARKRAEILSKWEKTEALRAKDQNDVVERVQKGQEWREERFKRMLDSITGNNSLAYKTAVALRERDAHEERRRRELHAVWESKVHAPLANQAHQRMNPPNRALQQQLTGSRCVHIQSPEEEGMEFALVENVDDNPARKQVVDHAKENNFHMAASSVLQGSHSMPDLRRSPSSPECIAPWPSSGSSSPASVRSGVVPRAMSRPVLEPTSWGQQHIQGSMFGHFAQAAEHGPGFRRAVRGGRNVHIPNRSDNVLAAGSRNSRILGHGDVGILRGVTATQGETANYKTELGANSGAPGQDHYTYETGANITNLEFPHGKRMHVREMV